jgi:nicotinamidase-related amidase
VKLERERAALVVVDVQEAFRPAVLDFDKVVSNVGVLVQGARALGLPVLVTEQYPQGLGATVPEVARHLDAVEPIEKVCFSAADSERFGAALADSGREQVLLCGIESHVCVSQTADDLLAEGREVHVARDAVSSRTAQNRELGLQKMERAGAVITSVEAALFELLRAAGTPEFKEIQRLVK